MKEYLRIYFQKVLITACRLDCDGMSPFAEPLLFLLMCLLEIIFLNCNFVYVSE